MTTFDGGPSRSQPRSWLFTPAMRPDRFDAAGRAGADVLIMDLEDAVALRDKDVARANALAALAGEQRSGPALALRVNALRTPTGLADVLAVLQQREQPDYLMVPKAAIHPSQVAAINAAFTPTDDQAAWARRILDENDKGIGVVDGQMIDEAVARKARRLPRKAGVMPGQVSR